MKGRYFPVYIALLVGAFVFSLQPAFSAPPYGADGVTGGDKLYSNNNLGATADIVKSGAGQIHSYKLANRSAGEVVIKLYDSATAVDETATPKLRLVLGAGEKANLADLQWQFASGIVGRCTTGIADNDTTAPSSNGCVVNLGYR